MRSAFVVLAFVIVAFGARVADACEHSLATFEPKPIAGDEVAPGKVNVMSTVVLPKSRDTMGFALSDCADIGTIRLTVSASDDRAQPKELGYQLGIIGDQGGVILAMPEKPVVPVDGIITVPFRGDDAFAVTFELRAVDGNGNIGPPTQHQVNVPKAFPWKLVVMIGAPILLVLIIVGIVMRFKRRR